MIQLLRTMKALCFLLLYLAFIPVSHMVNAQQNYTGDYAQKQLVWVEEKLEGMSMEEKLGQLFMVAAYSNRDAAHKNEIDKLIREHQIGGLIFFQGTPEEQVNLTNHFQLSAKVPLLIAIDAEWGLSMRLKDTPSFPRQLTLGAIQDESLIYDFGKEIARECRRMGIHVNLAPVVDVNNNPNNPVINDRSFGENKENVARKAISYMQGMEMNGILSCAKHFPGHGDTDKDSHHTLPQINHDVERLKDIELYPFREMIKNDVGSIMTAHLAIPALDNSPLKQPYTENTPSMPASLSKKITTHLLRGEMGYEGLVFTDALNMKGVSDHFKPGEVDLKALLAGNDILLFSEDVAKAIELIKSAVSKGDITEDDINQKVRKILKTKFRLGLEKFKAIPVENLSKDLNSYQAELLNRKLIANALTIARDDNSVLPIVGLEQQTIASLSLGADKKTPFQKQIDKYCKQDYFHLNKKNSKIDYDKMYDNLKYYKTVIIGLHDMSRYASKNHGIDQKMIELIYKLRGETNVVLCVFGSPYALDKFPNTKTIVVSYQGDELTQELTAQMIFGAIAAKGKLPISIPETVYQYGTGFINDGGIRLEYSFPEDVGIKSENLLEIDTIAMEAVKNGATPGCQILIAKENKVIFHKTYGHRTYAKHMAVGEDDIYDVASITKVAATLPVLMEMYENKKLNPDGYITEILPELKGTNKAKMKIKDILTHQARLKSWIPFYVETIEDDATRKRIYSIRPTATHSHKVAENMYIQTSYADSVWAKIVGSDLRSRSGYKYSDLGYYMFHRAIERYAGEPMEEYLQKNYYGPLGMRTAGFNPLERFQKEQVVPTENDTKYRRQLIQGYVHDMGSAMLGGVCGHAGLFTSTNDLAILMQMYLNQGTYGDRVYFDPATFDKFTAKQNAGCRRGLGFDKAEMNRNIPGPCSDSTTASTFGHTGFTGTCAWVDPENQMIYIFMSNRVYPDMNNSKLVKDNVRTNIQEAIYKAMDDSLIEQAQ